MGTDPSDRRKATDPGPAKFGVDELFFSRTDQHGVIQAGNSIFQRISEYSWDELHGAPHRIIRHPDMPKAVFWVLWDRLKRGLPVGAYVKNRTKSGKYYWVYAFITPIEGGYLSVRQRPCSEFFDQIDETYRTLRATEDAEGSDPIRSAGRLLGAIADLGFRDYDAFMASTAVAELAARQQRLATPKRNQTETHFGIVIENAVATLFQAQEVTIFMRQLRCFPINLSVQARRLPTGGDIFKVISSDYDRICRQIERRTTDFLETSVSLADRICKSVFILSAALVQQEMARAFELESGGDSKPSFATEIDWLGKQSESYLAKARSDMTETSVKARQFSDLCTDLNKLATSLDFARNLGTIEAFRLDRNGKNLQNMMTEAANHQFKISEHLTALQNLNTTVADTTTRLSRAV